MTQFCWQVRSCLWDDVWPFSMKIFELVQCSRVSICIRGDICAWWPIANTKNAWNIRKIKLLILKPSPRYIVKVHIIQLDHIKFVKSSSNFWPISVSRAFFEFLVRKLRLGDLAAHCTALSSSITIQHTQWLKKFKLVCSYRRLILNLKVNNLKSKLHYS